MSQEELYLKRQQVAFYKEIFYVGGIVPIDGMSRKQL